MVAGECLGSFGVFPSSIVFGSLNVTRRKTVYDVSETCADRSIYHLIEVVSPTKKMFSRLLPGVALFNPMESIFRCLKYPARSMWSTHCFLSPVRPFSIILSPPAVCILSPTFQPQQDPTTIACAADGQGGSDGGHSEKSSHASHAAR